jgi:hypothetical protein
MHHYQNFEKKFLIVPLKATIKKKHFHYINRNLILCHPLFSIVEFGEHRIQLVSAFLPASPAREQTGVTKLAGLLYSWQPLVKL